MAGLVLGYIWVASIPVVLIIAAFSVTQMGPEARQKGLDEIAPPTG